MEEGEQSKREESLKTAFQKIGSKQKIISAICLSIALGLLVGWLIGVHDGVKAMAVKICDEQGRGFVSINSWNTSSLVCTNYTYKPVKDGEWLID